MLQGLAQRLTSSCTLSSDWFQPVQVPCKWSHFLRSECILISLEYKKYHLRIRRMRLSIYASQLSHSTVKDSDGFYGEKGGICSLFDCFFQAKEMDTCLLSDTQLSNNEPLILFLIDIGTLRFGL